MVGFLSCSFHLGIAGGGDLFQHEHTDSVCWASAKTGDRKATDMISITRARDIQRALSWCWSYCTQGGVGSALSGAEEEEAVVYCWGALRASVRVCVDEFGGLR